MSSKCPRNKQANAQNKKEYIIVALVGKSRLLSTLETFKDKRGWPIERQRIETRTCGGWMNKLMS